MIAAGAVLAMVLGLHLVIGGRGMRRRRGDGSRMMPSCGPAYSITPNRSGWLGRNLGRMGASAKGETLDSDDSDEFATSINVGFGPGNSLWAGQ